MIIGITGSIGSGKTAAARLFSRHHFSIINADEISHLLMKNNPDVKRILLKNFGNKILHGNKSIDRKKFGNIVFNNSKKLNKLNSIMHLLILKEIKNKIIKIRRICGDDAKIIIDAPLLLEAKTKNFVDRIIVVKCDKKYILKRLNKKFSEDKIKKILNAQMPLKEKIKYADFVMDNNGDLKHLEKQVMEIIKNLI